MHKLVFAAALAAFFARPSTASACSVTELHPEKASPANGAVDVARDSAIVVSFAMPPFIQACSPVGEEWQVSVTPTAGGEALSGSMEPWNLAQYCSDSGGSIVWRPDTAFEPGVTYDVSVTWADLAYQTSFTAGADELPEVESTGGLVASTQLGVEVVQSCMQPAYCGQGGGCTSKTVSVLRAKLSGLSFAGGQEADGYEVSLAWRTSPSAPNSSAYVVQHVSAAELVDFELVLPDLGEAYAPCFEVTARDAAGNESPTRSTCLDELDPGELVPHEPEPVEAPPPQGDPTRFKGAANDEPRNHGCSVGGPASSGGLGAAALFFAIGALLCRRHSIARTVTTGR
jgi:hypothetical protein